MAGYQITEPTAGSTDWTSTATQREKQRKGFMAVSFTNWNTTDNPAINSGSVVEMSGSIYQFTSTEAISGTVTTSNPNYIYLTASSSALTASATSTAPTWSGSKQAWYDSGGTKRCIGGMKPDRSGKWLYGGQTDENITREDDNPGPLKYTVLEIGDWNMDSGATVTVNHSSIPVDNVRQLSVIVRQDQSAAYYDFSMYTDTNGNSYGFVASYNSTAITLQRISGGAFDSTNFNATSFNRGWVTICH